MKKIIAGKVYDTEKATEVGSFGNEGSWRDFQHFEETLFRKRTGEYFLFGEGGPATRYAEPEGQNSWSGGSRIMPMTYSEAREWSEKHLTADKFEKEFGAIIEDETTEIMTISLRSDSAEKLRRAAREQGKSLAAIIEEMISNI